MVVGETHELVATARLHPGMELWHLQTLRADWVSKAQALAVSGVTLYSSHHLAHCVEASASNLDRFWHLVSQDSRQHHPVLRLRRRVAQRRFAHWRMVLALREADWMHPAADASDALHLGSDGIDVDDLRLRAEACYHERPLARSLAELPDRIAATAGALHSSGGVAFFSSTR